MVAEQLLAGEGGNDLGRDAEARQDQDVDFRMAKKPEHVLEQNRIAASHCGEKTGVKMAVGEHHGDCAGQYRHHHHQQEGGDQPGPDKQRHLHQGHAFYPQIEDGDDDVDGPEYR